jgi:membrane protease YdiL (CAAX protease family)
MDFKWEQTFLQPVLILGLFTVGFLLYHIFSHSEKIHMSLKNKYDEQKTLILWIIFQKVSGFVFLGLIPAIISMAVLNTGFSDYGVLLINISESIYWILGISLIVILLNSFAAKKPDSLSMYPQIRIKHWTAGTAIISSAGWILYLLGYEFMFRGLLLFTFIPIIGVWPAIVLNITFYVLVHIPKGVRESIGCIPLGLILCVLTIKTGTIWVAFFTHVALALSNQFFSIKYHPEMSFITGKHKPYKTGE